MRKFYDIFADLAVIVFKFLQPTNLSPTRDRYLVVPRNSSAT